MDGYLLETWRFGLSTEYEIRKLMAYVIKMNTMLECTQGGSQFASNHFNAQEDFGLVQSMW